MRGHHSRVCAHSELAILAPPLQVLVFGGFNTMTEADLGELCLLALCPEAAGVAAVKVGGAVVAEGERRVQV